MPYRRSLLPSFYKAGNELFEDLIGLGFRLTGDRYNRNPNIENTLVAASIAALIDKTPRILPLLTDCCQDCMFAAAKKKADVKPLACNMMDKYTVNHLLHLEI